MNLDYILDNICEHIKSSSTRYEIDNLISSFTYKTGSSTYNLNFPAPAGINLDNQQITFNPALIAESVVEICDAVKGEKTLEEFVSSYSYWSNDENSVHEIARKVQIFLTIHELFHYIFTPSSQVVEDNIRNYCPQYSKNFVHLVHNIVEDSHIQPQGQKIFRSKYYNKILSFGQKFLQGGLTVNSYYEHIKDGSLQPGDVHNILYYLILRSYNPNNILVKTLFNRPDLLPFREETLRAFDIAPTIINGKDRSKYVCQTLIPLLYEDLKSSVELSPDGQPQESEDDEGSEGEEEGEEHVKNGTSGTGTETDNHQSEEGEGKDEGDGKDEEEEEGSEDKNQPSSDKSNRKTTDEKIEEGIKKLSQKYSSATNSPDMDKQQDTLQKLMLSSKTIEENSIRCENIPLDGNNKGSALDRDTMQLLHTYDAELSRLYNQKQISETRLLEGELDEDLVHEWYTEKNLNLFKQETKLVQDNNIKVTFALDRSGSMSGLRYTQCRNVLTALVHAFENNNIKTAVYLFNGRNVKIKDFEDPVYLNRASSNLYKTLKGYRATDGTVPLPTFEHIEFESNLVYDFNTINIVIFITDGCISNEKEVQQVVDSLHEKNYHIISIGLGLSKWEIDKLYEIHSDKVFNYPYGEATSLGEDLANLIIDNYVRV